MRYISSKDFSKLTAILDKLHTYFPQYGIDIKTTDTGWNLSLYPEGDDIGYKVSLSDKLLNSHTADYLAEFIYDKIALSYTE